MSQNQWARPFTRRRMMALGATGLAAAAGATLLGPATIARASALLRQSFDNGAEGVEITAANSASSGNALTSVTKTGGATATYAANAAVRGSKGARVVGADGDTFAMILSTTAATSASAQIYFYIDGRLPGGNWHIGRLRSATAHAALVVMTPTGTVTVQNSAGVSLKNFNGGSPLPSGEYYVNLQATRGTTTSNGSIAAQLYRGEDNSLVDSYTGVNVNAGTSDISQFSFGKPTSAGAVNVAVDSAALQTATTTPIAPVTGFVVGTTMPVDGLNAGLIATPTVTYAGPTTITGSVNPSAPTLIENKIISTQLTITSGYVRIVNCLITAPAPSAVNTGQILCKDPGVQGVQVYRCLFSPSAMSLWLDGIYGHHWTVERCVIEHVVDGAGSVWDAAGASDNHMIGSIIRGLSWYNSDPVNHPDGSGTHNDGIQHHGGLGLWVVGNSFVGMKFNALGTPALDSSTNSRYPQIGQIVLTAHTGAFVDDIHVNYNWITGGDNGLKFHTVFGSFSGAYAKPYDVECVGNRWIDDDQRYYAGKPNPIRVDDIVRLNGIVYSAKWTTDTNGNVYANVPAVAPALQGPVQIHSGL